MIQLEVWGRYACFSRPELHVERFSYDVPTPSAARGMVEAVFYHPGLKWRIRRIHVLSPIRFTNIRRNEIKSKAPYRAARNAMQGEGRELYIAASQDMTQRAALILQDVHYVIEAHFEMTDRAAPGDNPGKFQDIVTRRMERGQCYHTPYLGCREFPAYFRRSPPLRKAGSWVLCCMTWITPIRPVSRLCSSGPGSRTACSTRRTARCSDDPAGFGTAL